MKSNIIKIVIAGAAALASVSCSDFLNRPAEDTYNVSNFYKNDEQCIQGVNYLYNSPWFDFQRAFLWVGEIMSGNLFQGESKYLDLSLNGTDSDLVNMSYSLWAVNGHANTVIDNILNAEGPSQSIKNQCIGEALTWKAMAYFYMVRTFGEVPIIHNNTDMITSGGYNSVYKATKANVYEYIIMTLEKAMSLLPKTGVNSNGRIDYYAAEALLAKVYLTKAGLSGQISAEDMGMAADYAWDVIQNSGRDLMDEYSDVFRLQNNINKECLISWHWSPGRDPWTQGNSIQPNIAMTGFSDFEENCWGGWTGPSVDLQDAFGVSATDNPAVRIAEKDSRRKATMMMAGDTYDYFWTDKGGFDYLRFIYDTDYGKGGPSGEYQSPTGANMVKHLTGRQADHVAAVGESAMNMATGLATHLLRLSDVLLIYAEAKMGTDRQTSDPDAIEAFNRVRRRAGVDEITGVLTWEDVWKERRLELALEGDRWYDFVRRSYYDMDGAINEIKNQRRNQWYGLGTIYETYYNSGYQTWTIDETQVKYNTDTPAPNVTPESFTIPFPTEDLVFNPHLAEPAVDINVRELYNYDF